MFSYSKKDDDSLQERAAARASRKGPYPLVHTNKGSTGDITLPCGTPFCEAILTLPSAEHLTKPLNEFKFRCPRCGKYTYDSTITYNLN